jgi:hypothetical protein
MILVVTGLAGPPWLFCTIIGGCRGVLSDVKIKFEKMSRDVENCTLVSRGEKQVLAKNRPLAVSLRLAQKIKFR